MKSTGVVRRIDELGRIVLPIELRKVMDIAVKDSLEIFVEEDKIILKKYSPSCAFCGDPDNVMSFRGKLVCKICATDIEKLGKI